MDNNMDNNNDIIKIDPNQTLFYQNKNAAKMLCQVGRPLINFLNGNFSTISLNIKDEKVENIIKSLDSPIVLLNDSPLSITEMKLLYMYMGRINSRNEDQDAVYIEREELQKALNIKKISKQFVLNKLVNISKVQIKANSGKTAINLFSVVHMNEIEGDFDGIYLKPTSEGKNFFFNIEKNKYVKFRLNNVLPLVHSYSLSLYLYLVDNLYRFRSWKVNLEILKNLLGCNNVELYKNYKYFNSRVLKIAQKEINEKTDITYEYYSIRSGRKITEIEFRIIRDNTIQQIDEEVLSANNTNEDLPLSSDTLIEAEGIEVTDINAEDSIDTPDNSDVLQSDNTTTIDTTDTLNKNKKTKINKTHQTSNNWKLVSNIFGLTLEGSPTQKQLEYADQWLDQWHFSEDLIRKAYELCVDNTNMLKLPYINQILNKWHNDGITSLDDVIQNEKNKKKKSTHRLSSNDSYDIDELEKIL